METKFKGWRINLARIAFELILVFMAYHGFKNHPWISSGLLIASVLLALGWFLGWFEKGEDTLEALQPAKIELDEDPEFWNAS